jgi:hypothetical protein
MANKKPPASFTKNDPRINRKGRPRKEASLTEILRERADPVKLSDALLTVAYTGYTAAIKAVFDRIDGRPRETIELNSGGELDAKLTAILGGRK